VNNYEQQDYDYMWTHIKDQRRRGDGHGEKKRNRESSDSRQEQERGIPMRSVRAHVWESIIERYGAGRMDGIEDERESKRQSQTNNHIHFDHYIAIIVEHLLLLYLLYVPSPL
jgi:hypothetical protein